MTEWSSVKDKKPVDDQTVLVWQEHQEAAIPCICYYDEETASFVALFTWQNIKVNAKYWRPLPKPPKDNKGEIK